MKMIAKIDEATPYTLPETENHSFLFIHQQVTPQLEARLHRHEAWELYYVTQGFGHRTMGDELQPFSTGDVVLVPPAMPHQWNYEPQSANAEGNVCYLMVAFSPLFLTRIVDVFPEVRNALAGITLPTEARRYHGTTAADIRRSLKAIEGMNDLEQLSALLRLLPMVFASDDYTDVGNAGVPDKNVRRMMDIATYVMKHYVHTISLDDIASYVGMNRSSFCIYFRKQKGITFTQFVTNYRLDTAKELLRSTKSQVSDIAYSVGFGDLSHFNHVFSKALGMSPTEYRKYYGDNATLGEGRL